MGYTSASTQAEAGKSARAHSLREELKARSEIRLQTELMSGHNKLTRSEIEALIVDHLEHGRRLAWSFLTNWRIRMAQDDVMSAVGAALCDAAHRFDPDKGVSFKTFFFYHLRGTLLKEISRMIEEQRLLHNIATTDAVNAICIDRLAYANMTAPLIDYNNPERMIVRRERAIMCWRACSLLDPLEREVVVRHYVHDEALIDVAKELGYCRCHISRVKSRALKKLDRFLSSTCAPEDESNIEEIELAAKEESARSAAKRRDYTGGRGRRKQGNAVLKSGPLEKLFKRAVNY